MLAASLDPELFADESTQLGSSTSSPDLGGSPTHAKRKDAPQGPASVEPPDAIIAMLHQCSTMGLLARKRGNVQAAVTHLQRAVTIAKKGGRELSHPRVAVEAARIRLNLSSVLSRAGRHTDAIDAIQEAQQSLAGVLAWANSCETAEQAVLRIAEEATMLQCAANLAEAIELEPFDQDTRPTSERGRYQSERAKQIAKVQRLKAMQSERYGDAKALADDVLPEDHQLNQLAQLFSEGKSSFSEASQTVTSTISAGASGRKLAGSQSSPNLGQGKNRGPPPRDGSLKGKDRVPSKQSAGGRPRSGSDGKGSSPGTPEMKKRPPQRKDVEADASVPVFHRSGRGDPFGDFLAAVEYQKQLSLGSFQNWKQEEQQRQFYEKSRKSKTDLKSFEELERTKIFDNIYELKYTRPVHHMCMMNMTRDNYSRSDYDVVKEARKYNECPEAIMIRRIGCKLAGIEAINPKAKKKKEPKKYDLSVGGGAGY